MDESGQQKTRIIPLTRWNDYHPWPPLGGLRHLVFHADKTGFSFCIVRSGRRILIDEARFFKWIESQRQGVKGKRH